MNTQYEFFWQSDSPFSNWYPSEFEARGITFKNAEQYLMYMKSVIFGDHAAGQQVLLARHPRDMKAIGRAIKNYDDHVWDKRRYSVMYDAIEQKFTQNPELMKILLSTKGKKLVEASPYDKIWGIGLSADDPRALNKETWLGLNLLGECLTEFRDNRIVSSNFID